MAKLRTIITRFFHHKKWIRSPRCQECHKQGELYNYDVKFKNMRRMLLHSTCAKQLWRRGASVNLCQ